MNGQFSKKWSINKKEMLIVLSHHGNTNHNYFESLRPSSRNGYYDKRAQAGEDRTLCTYCSWKRRQSTIWESVWRVPKTRTPYDDTVTPSLGMYVKNSKSTCHSDSYSLCHKNIHKVKLCYQPKGLETDEWTKKMGYI